MLSIPINLSIEPDLRPPFEANGPGHETLYSNVENPKSVPLVAGYNMFTFRWRRHFSPEWRNLHCDESVHPVQRSGMIGGVSMQMQLVRLHW